VLTGDNRDKTVWLWDFATGRELRQFIGHSRPVNAGAFSPDGKFIITGRKDATARLWDTDYQYFTKGAQVPKRSPKIGCGRTPAPYFRAFPSYFVIY
jgi:WD40 repeat protein